MVSVFRLGGGRDVRRGLISWKSRPQMKTGIGRKQRRWGNWSGSQYILKVE